MIRRRLMAYTLSALLAGIPISAALVGVPVDPADIPLSCFIIHCEPTHASETMFLELTKLVSLAGQFEVPLTIDLTAQWAEMILADDEKTAALSAWIDAGHEIGGHHHAYWATLDRGAQWDGYTNTPAFALSLADQDRLHGTMSDYMALLDALPGERTSACMGLDGELDLVDWPKALSYSTSGHALEDCVSEPFVVDYAGHKAWQITHGLILQEQGALPALYDETGEAQVFAVVGHVYNFAEDPRPFEFWFRFLQAKDPEGARRRTVTEVFEERLPDGP